MDAGVLVALVGPRESEVVRHLATPGLRVVRRCADVAELLGAAGAGLGSVAVVSADLPELDRTVVARLAQGGVATVVVADPADAQRAAALGADLVRPAGSPVADLVAAVAAVARGERAGAPGPAPEPVPPGGGGPPDPPEPPTEGRVVVVWGPPGAPGRTTTAVNLAAELAALAGPVLLVDADTEAPSAAQVLGVLDDASGVAAAARRAAHGRLDVATLQRLSLEVEGGLRILTGLTRAERWTELPAPALEVVWDRARQVHAWTVVDVGPTLDEDPDPSDTLAPRRHQATASALAHADVIVVVGAAEPVGIRRLVMALTTLEEDVAPDAEVLVVVNRVRAGAAGPAPHRAVLEALARFAGTTDPLLVPDDRPAHDRAVLAGETLARVAPGSPARLALADLAHRLAGTSRRQRRARLLRRLVRR